MSDNSFNIEEMGSFFNLRAIGYEQHMKETVNSFDDYYKIVSEPMDYTEEPIEILDLGCGTGLEIKGIFEKAPNARITGIDLSEGMLAVLKDNYKERNCQLNIIVDSYLEYDFGVEKFDYVFGIMTMHHFLHKEKLALYRKIKASLKEKGRYIEGDYVVSKYFEKKWIKEREALLQKVGSEDIKLYHIDIPFALTTQKRLFKEAGFKNFEMLFQQEQHMIYVVF